ncbi:cation diffusion facilitator family transporter [Desulfosarcina sp.]|uniref:cation diffusion facilitator family transporter n=1 Tax=Desulfosarcina sp. TaxID=2027861 RepID=UPI0039705227
MSKQEHPVEPAHMDSCCPSIEVLEEANQHRCSGHHHGAALEDTSGPRLLAALALNLLIPVAQIIGGLLANSVALISDAMHNFSDFTAILISYAAFRIGRRGATTSNTFGYRRAEIMAALINVVLLAGASGVILYHAIERFRHPQAVDGFIVIILAGVGVVGNGLSAWLLHRDAAHSLNMRGAFLHMLGDLLTSVAVLINGLLLLYFPWYWLDPVLSVVIVVFILKNGWGLLKESTAVLMNATPGHLRLEKVRDYLCRLPGILGVHYLHAWQVSSSSTAFSCHVVVPDQPVSRTGQLAERIKNELLHRFRIDHPVLQFETSDCGHGALLCELACNGDKRPASEGGGNQKPFVDETASRIQPVVFHTLRLLLGVVFLYASYDKILHPQAFAQVVYNYQILPGAAVNLAALTLPWLELLLGLCLIAGVWLPGATALSSGLLAVFIGALVFNRLRGLDIHCGCFSTESTRGPAGLWTVLRDVGFLVVALVLMSWVFIFRPKDSQASYRE